MGIFIPIVIFIIGIIYVVMGFFKFGSGFHEKGNYSKGQYDDIPKVNVERLNNHRVPNNIKSPTLVLVILIAGIVFGLLSLFMNINPSTGTSFPIYIIIIVMLFGGLIVSFVSIGSYNNTTINTKKYDNSRQVNKENLKRMLDAGVISKEDYNNRLRGK